jgi:hypothetical protein
MWKKGGFIMHWRCKDSIMNCFFVICLLILILGLSHPVGAALTDMQDGTIYDTDLQLTWLKDGE